MALINRNSGFLPKVMMVKRDYNPLFLVVYLLKYMQYGGCPIEEIILYSI